MLNLLQIMVSGIERLGLHETTRNKGNILAAILSIFLKVGFSLSIQNGQGRCQLETNTKNLERMKGIPSLNITKSNL